MQESWSPTERNRPSRARGHEITNSAHLGEGDTIHLIETEEGILITPFDPDFEEAMALYAEGAKKYRNALRELAK